MDKATKYKKILAKNKGLLFILPWVLGFCIFSIAPLIYSIYMSMTDWGLVGTVEGFVGFRNYIKAFTSEEFYKTLQVTITYTIFAVPLSMIGSLVAALFLNVKLRGIKFFRAIYYLPVISSGVAIAVMWGWILASGETGVMNKFLRLFGISNIAWFNDVNYVIPSYVIIAVWAGFSGYLSYLVAVKDVPVELHTLAEMNGVGYFERLIKITIPLMKPILIYNLIMAIIASFRKFSEAYILGGAGGKGKFYMVYFYEEAFSYYNMGYAVALAWILVIIVISLVALVYKYTPFWDYYSSSKK